MKVEIVGKPAREGENVVGTIRFVKENGGILEEGPFALSLRDVSRMTTEEFKAQAIAAMKDEVKASRIERQWARAQAVLAPLEVEE